MIEKRPILRTQYAITLQDVYHVLFRHKWKIALLCSLGLIGALLVRITSFVPYQSEAKLYIRYVVDSKSPTQMGGTDSRVKSMDERAENVINTELQILTSFDLAQQVADTVTPQKILARAGGGTNRYQAAGLIQKGL